LLTRGLHGGWGRHDVAIVAHLVAGSTTRRHRPLRYRLASIDMSTFDVDAIRARFPALSLTHGGRPMVFFDGPGGTQVPESVIEAVARYYRESNANHGGAFPTSERSDAIVDVAHAALGDLLGVDADEITLGPNTSSRSGYRARSPPRCDRAMRPATGSITRQRGPVDRRRPRQRGDRPDLGAGSRRLHPATR
jgi:hypothetical protein